MTINGKEVDLGGNGSVIDVRKDVDWRIAKLRKVKVRNPGIIWHYTSIDVLEHFLKGEIALSHYKFMNDDDELEYGYKILTKIDGEHNDKQLMEALTYKHYGAQLQGDAFLFCLSRDGDSLYQWRSYTPKGGVAVAFDKVDLFSIVVEEVVADHEILLSVDRLKLIECRYDDKIAEKFLRQIKNRIMNSKKSGLCNDCKNRGLYVSAVIRTLLTHKNPSFFNEQEERLLLLGESNGLRNKVEFIAGKPRIILRNPQIANAIKAVRLSPHGDVKRNRLLVEMLRDKYGLKFDIVQSNSSYNGM